MHHSDMLHWSSCDHGMFAQTGTLQITVAYIIVQELQQHSRNTDLSNHKTGGQTQQARFSLVSHNE